MDEDNIARLRRLGRDAFPSWTLFPNKFLSLSLSLSLSRGHSKTMTRMLVCAVLARTQLSVALSLGFDLPCLTDVFIHGTNS